MDHSEINTNGKDNLINVQGLKRINQFELRL